MDLMIGKNKSALIRFILTISVQNVRLRQTHSENLFQPLAERLHRAAWRCVVV